MPTPELAVLGNLILDDVVLPDGSTRMGQAGGAALYAALAARLWGVEVGIVSVIGEDYPGEILDALTARGIDLAGVRRLPGPGLRTWLLYEGRRRRVVHRLDGPTHAEVSPGPQDLPAAWQPAVWHLAPMPFAVQRRLAAALAAHPEALISLDPYELAREPDLGAWHRLLAGIDLLFLSEDEMELTGGLEDPEAALRRLAPRGTRLRRVLYKRGADGGLAYDTVADRFDRWRALPATVADPTGAGDAFAGGLLAGRLRREPLTAAIERGLVAAAIALEGQGAEALLAAGSEAAEARRRAAFSGAPGAR